MRFEERPGETKFKDAYRALRELQVNLRAIAASSAIHQADLERIAGHHHLGIIERLIEVEHHAFLRTAPLPRMVVTEEDQRRDPKLSEALARLTVAEERARDAADEFERRLAGAMLTPTRLEPPPLPPAVIHLLPGEPNNITMEEAHRRLRELGHDPANYNGVLLVPADMPMIDLGDQPEEKQAAAALATILYEACEPMIDFGDEQKRTAADRVTEDIYERLRHELEPEHPNDPTGVDSPERHESPEDQA